MEPTHQVTRDVFDPRTGEKCLSSGTRVKAVNLGDQFFVWQIPYDALSKPVALEPWMVSRSLAPIEL